MRRFSVLLICCLFPAVVQAAAPEARANKPAPHVVVKGDTLWSIAAKRLKDPRKWKQIWEANKNVIKDPRLIYPNQSFSLELIASSQPAQTQPASVQVMPIQLTQAQPAQVPVISARVISIYGGVSRTGPQTIVVIDKGQRDGVENGLVLALYHNENKMAESGKPPAVPDASYGQLQVFRTFDKTSYAMVTRASLQVSLLDTAATLPEIAKNDAKRIPETHVLQTNVNAPASNPGIQQDRRDGEDARKCLELGSNREIAACAEKYR